MLIFYIIRCTSFAFSLLIILSLFYFWYLETFTTSIPAVSSLLFFYAGSLFALKDIRIQSIDRYSFFIFVCFLLVLLVDIYGNFNTKALFILKSTIGVCFLFVVSEYILNTRIEKTLSILSGPSFFIYAAHEPFLTILRKLTFSIYNFDSQFSLLVFYFLSVIITTCSCLLLYFVITKYFSTLAFLLSGRKN